MILGVVSRVGGELRSSVSFSFRFYEVHGRCTRSTAWQRGMGTLVYERYEIVCDDFGQGWQSGCGIFKKKSISVRRSDGGLGKRGGKLDVG